MGCIADHSTINEAFNQGPKSLEIQEGKSGPPQAFSAGRCNLMCSEHKFFALFNGGQCHCSDMHVDDAFISKQKLEKRKCDAKERAFAVYRTGILQNALLPLTFSGIGAGARRVSCLDAASQPLAPTCPGGRNR